MNESPKFQTSHAILLLKGKYVLQLRDNKSGIAVPGQWSLFGGKIDKGETRLSCIKREIYEELTIRPKKFHFLWSDDYYAKSERQVVRTWFYVADVGDVWCSHQLKEGQDVKAFMFKELGNIKIPMVMCRNIKKYHERNI